MMGFEQLALKGEELGLKQTSTKMSAGDQDKSRMQVKCCKSLGKKQGADQKKHLGQGSKQGGVECKR